MGWLWSWTQEDEASEPDEKRWERRLRHIAQQNDRIIDQNERILTALRNFDTEVQQMANTQDDLNADAALITQAVTQLGLDATAINDAIAALKTANPAADTTALDAAVASLGTTTATITSIAPPVVAPPVDVPPPTA